MVDGKAVFEKWSSETKQALKEVKAALKVMNKNYSKADKEQNSADGASSGNINLFKVCESDFRNH